MENFARVLQFMALVTAILFFIEGESPDLPFTFIWIAVFISLLEKIFIE